jgi:hypothetical protein
MLHIIGYRNTGTGEICALIINTAAIIKISNIGSNQILFVLSASAKSCFTVSSTDILYHID